MIHPQCESIQQLKKLLIEHRCIYRRERLRVFLYPRTCLEWERKSRQIHCQGLGMLKDTREQRWIGKLCRGGWGYDK